MRNLPSLLSISRLIAAALITVCYFLGPHWQTIFILFLWSGFSDFLDGWFARRYHLTSPFGAWLDHLSDKVVVLTTITLLSWRIDMLAMALCTLLIINREIFALGLRSYPSLDPVSDLQVSRLGKVKTLLQFVSLTLLILSQILLDYAALLQLGLLSLVMATAMAYISLWGYWSALGFHWYRSFLSSSD